MISQSCVTVDYNYILICCFVSFYRVLETFSVKLLLQVKHCELLLSIVFLFRIHDLVIIDLLQLILFFICHPNWDVRNMAHDATRKIVTTSPQLSEDLLLEFSNFLSVVGEKIIISKTR